MLSRRGILGCLSAACCGLFASIASATSFVKKTYITIHSNKKDEQYGIVNGTVSIYDKETHETRWITIRNGNVEKNTVNVAAMLTPGEFVLNNRFISKEDIIDGQFVPTQYRITGRFRLC